MTDSTAFEMIRLAVSPMPIGRILGFLSRAISLEVRNGAVKLGSTNVEQSLCATMAS